MKTIYDDLFTRAELQMVREYEERHGSLRDLINVGGRHYARTRRGALIPVLGEGGRGVRQYFQAPDAEPSFANITLSAFTTEVGMLSAANIAIFCPFAIAGTPNGPQVGKIYRVFIGGSIVFAASGTMTLTPRYGTTTSGASFGLSGAQTVPISVTSPFVRESIVVCRVISSTASSSTFSCKDWLLASGTLATAGSGVNINAGGTVATCDTTIANGFFHGITASASTSGTIHEVFLVSLN